MSAMTTIARKELRAYFASPVALIFLAIFLVASLFSIFGTSSFFARNIADVRPLFEWFPILLILLVAAISMRQWSEERKMGTLEVLLTLPITIRDMVIGKFLAGVALIAVALALTLPVPIMVSMVGPLDWGPVVGGYVGALLLGAAYLSIGLCVSARTDNQVVALMTTLVVGGVLYLLGSDRISVFFGNTGAELLHSLGTGSRFLSIERGVLDLRDMVYYVGLALFFLTLNWYFLESERVDHDSESGGRHTLALRGLVALVGLNVLALNLWLAPVSLARIDLTQGGDYSVSEVTIDTLQGLREPLQITGYFSERTHPLLAPLVPQIRDTLEEYAVVGGDSVNVDFLDPNTDEALEQELAERYSIRSVPFRVADRHQQAVVNSFFHILVQYGDQFETLSFDQLIDVRADESELEVRLRNLEYDLTRTIKRVSQDFQNMESVFAQLPGNAKVTAYITPGTLPEDFAELPGRLQAIASEFEAEAAGKFSYEVIDPSRDAALQDRLADEFDIRPLAVDLFGQRTFYMDLVVEAGGKVQRIMPRSDLTETELRGAFESAIRRATPGQLKTIGLYTETPVAPPPNPQIPPQYQPPPPRPDYRALGGVFGEEYSFENLDLEDGIVPETIDVLLLAKAGDLSDRQQFAIDQFLMRGGKLIVLAGRYVISADRSGLDVVPHESPLFAMLERWGVEVGPGLVLDPQNAPFPVPVEEQRGGFRLQRIEMIPYPFFVDVREDGFDAGHPSFSGLQGLTTPWASPLAIVPVEGVESEVLIETSSASWIDESGSIEPDLQRYPGVGFAPTGDVEARVVAVALSGRFPSNFADRPSPLFTSPEDADAPEGAIADATGRTMKESLPDAGLVVIGSSEMASDLLLAISQQPGGEVHRGNIQWIQNLVDWSVEDTDLLQIRSSGAFARTLRPMSEAQSQRYEVATYSAVALLLIATAFVSRRIVGTAALKRFEGLAGKGRES